MANRDIANGFSNPKTRDGGPLRLSTRKNAGEIFKGDAVKDDGSGRVVAMAADTDFPIGIAMNYVSSTAGQTVLVCEDLDRTTWEVQVDDNSITDDTQIGVSFGLIYGAGNSTTELSGFELDGSDTSASVVYLTDMIERPDNDDALANNRVRVQFQNFGRAQSMDA